jgi:hypothetical protein
MYRLICRRHGAFKETVDSLVLCLLENAMQAFGLGITADTRKRLVDTKSLLLCLDCEMFNSLHVMVCVCHN